MKAYVSRKTGEFIITGNVKELDGVKGSLICGVETDHENGDTSDRQYKNGQRLWTLLDDIAAFEDSGPFSRDLGAEVEVLR